jgi:serine/threonine-protein kinase
MKLVRGAPLDALPPVPLAERLRIVERLCEAVAFAHAHGVVHRDLKPPNVMVGPFGEVLVMDWGVAKVTGDIERSLGAITTSDDAPDTGHGVVLGTPAYMAPEQAAGDAAVDARADVYAVGGILRDLAQQGRSNSDQVARPLRAIIQKAMAADPAARYGDTTTLARDVAAFRAGERVSAYRENLFEQTQRLVSRYRTPILLVLAYLVMRIALVFVSGR